MTRIALFGALCLSLLTGSALADGQGDLADKVKRFFDRFDGDKDGVVTKVEFGDARLFEKLDVDRDGKITQGDFGPLEADPKAQPKDDAVANLFKAHDKNGDGKISREEMAGDPRTFHALDRNTDGVVDKAEAIRITAVRAAQSKQGSGNDMGGGDMGGGDMGGGDMGGGTQAPPMKPKKGDQRRGGMGRLDADGDGKVSKAEFMKAQEANFARLDKNGDGTLDAEEMKAMRGGRQGRGQGQQGRGGAELAKRFMQRMDKNGDGVVTRDEAHERMPFDQIDADGDGKLTADEMGKFAEKMRAMRGGQGNKNQPGRGGDMSKRIMQRLDKNGDGAITRDEAPERLPFDQLDTDKDGKLTAEELGKMMQRRQR